VTLITLGAISSVTIISVWLIEVLVEDEFVAVVADVVLSKTTTRATNKFFVNSISEKTKNKEILICYILGGTF